MPKLDTRGFMDGAMQGFEMMDRYYDRKDDNKRRDQLLSLKQAQAQREQQAHDFNYGGNGKKGYLQKKADQDFSLNEARIDNQRSQIEIREAQLNETKRVNQYNEFRTWRTDNKPQIESMWLDRVYNGRNDTNEAFLIARRSKAVMQIFARWTLSESKKSAVP